MKKLVCLLLVLGCVVFCFAGCAQQLQELTENVLTPSDDVATVENGSSAEGTSTQEDASLTAKGYPPIGADLQDLYGKAYEVYADFTYCSFDVDNGTSYTINGMPYHPISDSRYNTYDKMEDYLETLFTEDFVDNNLLTGESCVQEGPNGEACLIEAGMGGDITYAGHHFMVDQQTDTQIDLTALVYFTADQEPWEGEPFYSAPQAVDKFTTEQKAFQLVKTDDGWRFSKFELIG